MIHVSQFSHASSPVQSPCNASYSKVDNKIGSCQLSLLGTTSCILTKKDSRRYPILYHLILKLYFHNQKKIKNIKNLKTRKKTKRRKMRNNNTKKKREMRKSQKIEK